MNKPGGFVRKYLEKEPKIAAMLTAQAFMESCRKRAKHIGMDEAEMSKLMGITKGRLQHLLDCSYNAHVAQLARLAGVLGGRIELKLVIDHPHSPNRPKHYAPKNGANIHGEPKDIAAHPMTKTEDE